VTGFEWALTFSGILMLAALVISVACLRIFAAENAREDATYGALRSPGMGDLRSVPDEVDSSSRFIETEWWLESGGAS